MKLGQFDMEAILREPKYFLCKPNRKVIRPLKDIYDDKIKSNLGKVNEFTFTIPTQIERQHQLIDNPLIDEIKHRYLIMVVKEHQTEYFIHFEHNKKYSDKKESINYTAYSIGYMLADKPIRGYKAESKNLTYIATDLLKETNWAVGYVDADFDLKFRQHEITNQNVLQAIYELAEKFGALIVWDTVRLRIHFYKPFNVGLNRGLKLKEGKYLESFDYKSNSEDVPTRVYLYGSEGLTIRRLTPTGVPYIEDFSHYMYPFEMDKDGNVIRSSIYMEDDLCIALTEYNKALISLQGNFDALTKQLKLKQDEKQQKEQTISKIKADIKIENDKLDLLNSENKGGTTEHTVTVAKIEELNTQVAVITNEITIINEAIALIETQIASQREKASLEKYLNSKQLTELNDFIIIHPHENTSIIDDEDLLEEGLSVFQDLKEPKVNLTISLVDLKSILVAQNDWDKIGLGDTITLVSKRLKINITAKIIEITENFKEKTIELTIANEKEIKDSQVKLMEMIYKSASTSTSVDMDRHKWNMIEQAQNMISQLLNKEWDATKQNILAGYKQEIIIGERGIILKSLEDPMSWLVAQNGMIAITNDNGNTWKTAISKNGIHAERIIGKLIMGNRLIIEDEDGIIRISGSVQEVFDKEGKLRIALGEYEPNKIGLKIENGAIEIVNGLTKENIDPNAVAIWDNAEKNAKEYADSQIKTVNTSVQELLKDVEDLQDEISAGFRDGIIEESEAIAIEKYINELNMTKGSMNNEFTIIYNDSYLAGNPKTSLNNAKEEYNTAHTNLINSIAAAISDKKTTVAEKEDVDAKFAIYNTKISDLHHALQTAILSIQTAKTNAAQQAAIDHANTKDTQIRGDLRLTSSLPTSITLNSNGITAFTNNSNNFARLDYRGLYVQGGAVDIRTSGSTSSGVIFNGNGISAYDYSGTRTFFVDTNGYLTATSGTFRGNIEANSGYFSGALNGATGTFNGVYTGTLNADQIRGSSFVVGYGTGSTLTLTSLLGSHSIHSSDASGFQITTNGTMSLKSYSGIGIYTTGAPLVIQDGFRVDSGTTQFYGKNGQTGTVTINGTLNVTSLNVTGGGGVIAVFG